MSLPYQSSYEGRKVYFTKDLTLNYHSSHFNFVVDKIFDKDWNLRLQAAQKKIDEDVVNFTKDYLPYKSGQLSKHFELSNRDTIGTGVIVMGDLLGDDDVRFLYYGKLMVNDEGSPWAKSGEKKHVVDKDLNYDTSVNPLAGPRWFERMVADKRYEIYQDAREAWEDAL